MFWAIFGLLTNLPVGSQIFYQQNFDQLQNSDLAGQDGWSNLSDGMADFLKILVMLAVVGSRRNQVWSVGRASALQTNNDLRRFVGDYDGIQYLTFRFLYQSGNAPLSLYAGGSLVGWAAASKCTANGANLSL